MKKIIMKHKHLREKDIRRLTGEIFSKKGSDPMAKSDHIHKLLTQALVDLNRIAERLNVR